MNILEKVKKDLIVSCQALENEPLHDSYIMSKMALAAKEGGATGIRANSVKDIMAIKGEVDLPIIGIIKKDYPNSHAFITPTIKEIEALYNEGVDMIAFDATNQTRPDNQKLEDFVKEIKEKFPDQLFMADVSTLEEGVQAAELGIDVVATTLAGYTPYSVDVQPLQLVEDLANALDVPVIAEGNINTPEKAEKALKLGAHAVVVGSSITRPQLITRNFKRNISAYKDKSNQI